MNNKIGIGIITCDRPAYLTDLLNSLNTVAGNINSIIIVDDGDKPSVDRSIANWYVHKTTGRIGVGRSKNIALNYLLKEGNDYIFLLEDDIVIKDNNVFLINLLDFSYDFNSNSWRKVYYVEKEIRRGFT